MTLLVAALLFGVSGVAGVTVVTLAALSYAKHLDAQDALVAEEDRCPVCYKWRHHLDSSGSNYKNWRERCQLPAGHQGPHLVTDVRDFRKGEKLWFDEKHPRVVEKDIP